MSHPFAVESFCAYSAAYILVIFETLILTRIKSKIFFTSRRTALIFAILIIVVGSFYTALASEYLNSYEIAAQAGVMVLSAVAVWKAPTIREDKILLKSLMTTIPATSLTVAIVLSGSLLYPPIYPPTTPEKSSDENGSVYLNNSSHLTDNVSFNDQVPIDNRLYLNDNIYIENNAGGNISQNYYSPKSDNALPGRYRDLYNFLIEASRESRKNNYTMLKHVAFFQWYLKIHGFNVTFVKSNNFRNQSLGHIWLMNYNNPNEKIPIEPRFKEFGEIDFLQISPEYRNYDEEFKDIYELSNKTGGTLIYSWRNLSLDSS